MRTGCGQQENRARWWGVFSFRSFLRVAVRTTVGLVLGVLLLEGLLRVVFYPSFEFDRLVEADPFRWIRFRPGRQNFLTNQIPSAWNAKAEYRTLVRINSQGLRAERNFSPAPPGGVTRLLCLGDSITFGWAVEEAYSYPALLERYLRESAPGQEVEVINAGFPSYTSRQGLIWLDRELLALHPQAVIIQFGFNDSLASWQRMSGPLRFAGDNEVLAGRPGDWELYRFSALDRFTALLNRTHTTRIALMLFTIGREWLRREGGGERFPGQKDASWESRAEYRRPRVPPAEFRANLLMMVRLCQERQTAVFLVDTWGTPAEYRQVIKRTAEESGAGWISQTEVIRQAVEKAEVFLAAPQFEPLAAMVRVRFHDPAFLATQPLYYFLVDYLHPSEAGNVLFVEALGERLRPGSRQRLPPGWYLAP